MAVDNSILGVLVAGIGSLTTAISILWKRVNAFHKHTVKKLDECEEDREKLWKQIAKINGDDHG